MIILNHRGFRLFGLAMAMAVVGCGGDGPRQPEPASPPPAQSQTPVEADSGTAEAACAPVGEELEAVATETIAIKLSDYAFTPGMLEVGSGVVTFAAENIGGENHELAFLPGGGEVPLNDEGAPDEDTLAAAGAFELEAFGSGQTCNATYDLDPGTYTLFCIVTSADGETHYDKGMRGQLVVS